MEHTKGEWLTYCGEENWFVIVKDKPNRPDRVVCKIINESCEEANAQRIVDCVNGCEGINPEAVRDLYAACTHAKAVIASVGGEEATVKFLHKAIAKADSATKGGGS